MHDTQRAQGMHVLRERVGRAATSDAALLADSRQADRGSRGARLDAEQVLDLEARLAAHRCISNAGPASAGMLGTGKQGSLRTLRSSSAVSSSKLRPARAAQPSGWRQAHREQPPRCAPLTQGPEVCSRQAGSCRKARCTQRAGRSPKPRSNQGLLPPSMSCASLDLIWLSAGLHTAGSQLGLDLAQRRPARSRQSAGITQQPSPPPRLPCSLSSWSRRPSALAGQLGRHAIVWTCQLAPAAGTGRPAGHARWLR